jgi:uncharacterized membrane protein
MHKSRLEAFSDGVIAIIITIMVLELKVPEGTHWADLSPLWPVLGSYLLSFIFIGIYWVNHHHLLQVAQKVNGPSLWANNHLLFWLSLVPFTTSWMGENHFAAVPVAVYGVVLLCAGAAYKILAVALIRHHGSDSLLAQALASDVKGNISVFIYLVAVVTALWQPLLACALYLLVAIIWLVPDRRIEKLFSGGEA